MQVNSFENLEIYKWASEMQCIANESIRRVKEENKRLGLPLVYSFNGRIVYEMPDGTLTYENPSKK
jgi:hypothetical protein